MNEKKIFLTIGGSDPSGGAGVQADIRTADRLKLYPCSVITELTAQNSSGVSSISSVDTSIVESQLKSVFSDFRPDAVKIGMVRSKETIELLGEFLMKHETGNIVVDPVLSPTLADMIPEKDIVEAYSTYLFPIATLITPNIPEKDVIENYMGVNLENLCDAFLLKGGHLENSNEVSDVLFVKTSESRGFANSSAAFPTLNFNNSGLYDFGASFTDIDNFKEGWEKYGYRHKRIISENTHGSGCVLSSAIACYLALGYHLEKAVGLGIRFTTDALSTSAKYKITQGNYGPSMI